MLDELHKILWSEGEHLYLSTSCLHDECGYCKSDQGAAGPKRPAECKFCGAPCVCSCHDGDDSYVAP